MQKKKNTEQMKLKPVSADCIEIEKKINFNVAI